MTRLRLVLGRLLIALGLLATLLLAACWTDYPWRIYRWFSMPEAQLQVAPEYIVVMGGGGIPSESGLMRTYYGAEAAHRFPDATVVIALPGDPTGETGALGRMREELERRGVARDRIQFEPRGTNTRSQAIEWRRQWDAEEVAAPVLIITSPEHMRRSVRTFQRAGFLEVGSVAAYDTSIESDLALDEDGVDSGFALKSVEGSLFVRYQFWHGISYLGRSAREAVALLYYKLKGWA